MLLPPVLFCCVGVVRTARAQRDDVDEYFRPPRPTRRYEFRSNILPLVNETERYRIVINRDAVLSQMGDELLLHGLSHESTQITLHPLLLHVYTENVEERLDIAHHPYPVFHLVHPYPIGDVRRP
jgi:hypothetical protein